MLTGMMAIRYSLIGPSERMRERAGETLGLVVARRAEHERALVDLEPPVAHERAGIAALGDLDRGGRRIEGDPAAAGGLPDPDGARHRPDHVESSAGEYGDPRAAVDERERRGGVGLR